MINPEEIAFDIDGVFADTMGLFIDIVRKEYGITRVAYTDITRYYLEECLDLQPDIITAVIKGILQGDYQLDLQPIEGSCSVLSSLNAQSPLLFVTARPTVSPIKEWVCQMLPESAFPVEVVATGALEAKAGILKERRIRYFVEDCLDVCYGLDQQGITPLVFCQPWNRSPHPFQEIRSWNELKGLLGLGPP